MKLELNYTDITLRPSSIDTFLSCPRQWALTHLAGHDSIPAFRAAIGTAIHAGAERTWAEAATHCNKDLVNIDDTIQAALDCFEDMDKEGRINYKAGEIKKKGKEDVVKGSKTFYEDIYTYEEIPTKVEFRLSKEVDNPIISKVSGTVDYITLDTIADLKTSTRKIYPDRYNMQQATYKLLAKHNNFPITKTKIQAVVLNKNPYGEVLEFETNEDVAESAIDIILKTCEIASKDLVPLEVLFRGNPKHNFCKEDYCAFYYDCPYTKNNCPF